ncbi:MAG: TolC family protein [Muribaculaceae bacterium]|nr:TolC family protein [Muribaculaceae bacterium]
MSNRLRIYMLAVAACALLPALSKAEQVTLSLQKCLEIALQDNPTVRIADMEVNKVDYAKKETLASVFPAIDFSANYQRSIELQTIRMDLGGQSQSIKMGSDNTWNLGFSASLPIIAPSLWKAIDISNTQILASLEEARASKLDLVDQVNKAYYALMLGIASKNVIQQNYDIALFNAEIYKKQFENGTASEYDVLRSSVQIKNIEPELLQADIAIKQCQLQLKILMGIQTELEILPDITLNDLQKSMYAYPSSTLPSLVDNSQLRSLEIQSSILKKNVTLKKFAWIPTLGAAYTLSWTALSNGSPIKNQQFNPYSYVGVSLSVPIFSGGSKLYGLKQAQVQLKELEIQKEYLINSLDMQVSLAIDNINREAAQIESSREGMEEAQKAYSIMQKSFEIGAASYLDLRDAELANTSAQLAYFQAIYNYLISNSELDLLLGKEDALNNKN